jgi:SAM-dependent methyltransferase
LKAFDAYSKYYDFLYKDKDYKSETDYICRFIRKFNPDALDILNLGCGTGRHDVYLAGEKYDVTGVEISESMYSMAVKNAEGSEPGLKVKFINEDIRKLRLGRTFDIITSLFHVMSYQTSNEDIVSTLRTVRDHLKPGGKFFFDFWYGPAVLTDRPVRRVKKFEDSEWKIERIAEPELRLNDNIVDINFRILVENVKEGTTQEISEVHRMRYFFLPELEYFLDSMEMKIEHTEEWMTGNNLSDKSWYGFAVIELK